MGHKGPFIRPRCIGTVRARTQMLVIIIVIIGTACMLHEILRINSTEGKGKDEVSVNTMKAYGCGGLAPLFLT
jgi:hypothetical protein